MAKAKKQAVKKDIQGMVWVAYNSPRAIRLTTSKGEKVLINGSPVNKILDKDGKPTRGRFGLTQISADVWEDLKKTYKNASWFTCNPPKMFAHEEAESTEDQAEELKDETHGFEQADPEKLATSELKEETQE